MVLHKKASQSVLSVQTDLLFVYDFCRARCVAPHSTGRNQLVRCDALKSAAFRQAFRVKQDDGLFLHPEQSLRFERFQTAAQHIAHRSEPHSHFVERGPAAARDDQLTVVRFGVLQQRVRSLD